MITIDEYMKDVPYKYGGSDKRKIRIIIQIKIEYALKNHQRECIISGTKMSGYGSLVKAICHEYECDGATVEYNPDFDDEHYAYILRW